MGHFGFVNDHAGIFPVSQLCLGKWITDDVLGHPFFTVFIVAGNSYAVMDAEAGRMPPAHDVFDQGVVYSAFIFEHLKHVRPKKSREVIQINLFGHDVELAVAIEKAISHNTMYMRMPSTIITKRMDGHNRAKDSVFNTGNGS